MLTFIIFYINLSIKNMYNTATYNFQFLFRRYKAEILPIRHYTISNQTINFSCFKVQYCVSLCTIAANFYEETSACDNTEQKKNVINAIAPLADVLILGLTIFNKL